MPLGAATTDIIVQYVSTIKALREMDASGVLLEAIADPIREYLRSRKVSTCCSGWRESRLAVATACMATRIWPAGSFKRRGCHAAMQDTIRCIVTMLTDDSAGDVPGGESLFQELDRPDHGPEVGRPHPSLHPGL
jgi:hypothetical protein